MNIAIKLSIPSWEDARLYSDYYFAKGLKKTFVDLGYACRIDITPEWYRESDDLAIVIRGTGQYTPKPHQNSCIWCFNYNRLTTEELDKFDCVFVASASARLKTVAPCYVLMPCADNEAFPHDPEFNDLGNVYFGDYHFGSIIEDFQKNQIDVTAYGKNWHRILPDDKIIDKKIPYKFLCKYLSSAQTVLFHKADFVPTTLFNAAACGARIIMPYTETVKDIFGNNILMYNNWRDIPEVLTKEVNKEELMATAKEYTFKKCCDTILETLNQIY